MISFASDFQLYCIWQCRDLHLSSCILVVLKRDLSVRVRGCSCELNNQLNVLYHVRNWGVSEVQVVHKKTSLSPLPVFHY